MSQDADAATNPYRLLPSIDDALRLEEVVRSQSGVSRDLLIAFVQGVLNEWREEIRAGSLDGPALQSRLQAGALGDRLADLVREEQGRGVRRAINATGVVLHTGLGRSPVNADVARRMAEHASGYCVLEVDRFTGQRNERDARLSVLLGRLTGCEAAIAVNNNAAAVFLVLNSMAQGGEAIVSRGELVEIGGSFRVPDVMSSAGVKLVEVGTTNRTRIADYAGAIGADTGMLMKVHTSNFRVIGFTEDVQPAEIAELGRERGISTSFDLGSGRFEVAGASSLAMLEGESEVRDAVQSGIDLVTFSGDKLLGGPQAGLIVGTRAAVGECRKNPLYRALRLDKSMLTGLEGTLELLLAGKGDEIPARAMMNIPVEVLKERATALAGELAGLEAFEVQVLPERSQPGSGSAPGVYLDTFVVRLRHRALGPDALGAALRAGDPPVFARIQDDALFLDPRTFLPGDLEGLTGALRALAE